MTDRPILFSAPMVRALLAGSKTQTRRILKEQPPEWATYCEQPEMLNALGHWVPSGLWRWSEPEQTPPRALRQWPVDSDGDHYWMRLPFAPGDRLWVKETWAPLDACTHNDPGSQAFAKNGFYRADDSTVEGEISKWRPSIFMPRSRSRLTLIVTDVRVQRLQDITLGEICAEGLATSIYDFRPIQRGFDAWIALWDSINGAGAWEANPWVVAVSFDVIKGNIDG